MAVVKGLPVDAGSVSIHHPSNSLDLIVEDKFQFRSLDLVQKYLNGIQKIHPPMKKLSCECALHVTEKSEV
jgi:hypothetical protein